MIEFTEEQRAAATFALARSIHGNSADHEDRDYYRKHVDIALDAAAGVAPPAPSADREKLIAEAKNSCHYNDGHVLKRVTDALAAPAPVDEAKLAQVIEQAERDYVGGSAPKRRRLIARAVREYLEGE